MSKSVITDSLLTAIANAIRAKTGSAATMTPADMATAIGNIPSGSGATEPYIEYVISSTHAITDITLHGFTEIVNSQFYNGYTYNIDTSDCAITRVGQNAFYNSSIRSFAGMSGLTEIGTGAFKSTSHLYDNTTPLVIPSGLTTIPESAFESSHINSTALPAGLTSIGKKAFYKCTFLAVSALPSTLVTIGDSAFQQCNLLTVNEIPAGVTTIGSAAFGESRAITSAKIPATVTSIGTYAWNTCNALATVIDFSNAALQTGVFASNAALTEARLIGQPASMASNVFGSCPNLANIYVSWTEGTVSGAPWGATNATIHYGTTFDASGNVV